MRSFGHWCYILKRRLFTVGVRLNIKVHRLETAIIGTLRLTVWTVTVHGKLCLDCIQLFSTSSRIFGTGGPRNLFSSKHTCFILTWSRSFIRYNLHSISKQLQEVVVRRWIDSSSKEFKANGNPTDENAWWLGWFLLQKVHGTFLVLEYGSIIRQSDTRRMAWNKYDSGRLDCSKRARLEHMMTQWVHTTSSFEWGVYHVVLNRSTPLRCSSLNERLNSMLHSECMLVRDFPKYFSKRGNEPQKHFRRFSLCLLRIHLYVLFVSLHPYEEVPMKNGNSTLNLTFLSICNLRNRVTSIREPRKRRRYKLYAPYSTEKSTNHSSALSAWPCVTTRRTRRPNRR